MPVRICKGRTKRGEPCKSPFVDADGYCPAHTANGAARMRARGRKGAEKTNARRRREGLPPDRLGSLETPADAQRWLRLIAEAVGALALTHAEGSTMTSAVRAWLAAEDARLRSEDLAELQRQVAELKRGRRLEAMP